MTGAFRTINPPTALPFSEGFASATFPPSGWNYVHFNPNNKMSRNAVGGFGLSTGSMKMDNYSGAMNIIGQLDYLMSPVIDFTSGTANTRSEEHTSELQSLTNLVCRLLLEKKKKRIRYPRHKTHP